MLGIIEFVAAMGALGVCLLVAAAVIRGLLELVSPST
jgi:hypothetical protein